MTALPRPLRTVVALLAAAVVLLPVTEAAAHPATAPPGTDAPAEATPVEPVPTEPPATESPATPTTDAPGAEDDSTDIPWGTILLVAGLVLVLLLIAGALTNRRSTAATRSAAPRRADPAQSSLLSTSQWIHDQLSLELLAAPAAGARQRWATERSRLDNVAIGAQQQWTEGHGEAWQRLGQTTSALAGAIETNISLREQAEPNPQLVQESIDVVNRNRAVQQQLVSALWPNVRG